MENSRTCEICIVNVHRASYVKRLRKNKRLENIKQIQMIIPEWFFKQEQLKTKEKLYITLKH